MSTDPTIEETCAWLRKMARKRAKAKDSVGDITEVTKRTNKLAQGIIVIGEATYINGKRDFSRTERLPAFVTILTPSERRSVIAMCKKIVGAP